MPSISCSPGQFVSTKGCIPCSIGHYSNATSAPWPTQCVLCDAGKFSQISAAKKCNKCPAGFPSSPDRTYCAKCDAGQYMYEERDCIKVSSGHVDLPPFTLV
jgi:hypothetical protein